MGPDKAALAAGLEAGGGGAPGGPPPGGPGGPPGGAPPMPNTPEEAMALVEQLGIPQELLPVLAKALSLIGEAVAGGAGPGGPPPGPGGPPPGPGGPPPPM